MSISSPYAHVDKNNLSLRDLLAVDRTIAANERTFLGYLRTTLALVATGGSLLHFVDATWAVAAGVGLVVAGMPLLFVGTRSYVRRRHALRPLLAAKGSHEA